MRIVPGAKSLGELNSPIVASTFFNAVHLFPKDIMFTYEGAKLVSCHGTIF